MKVSPDLYKVTIAARGDWGAERGAFEASQKVYEGLNFLELAVFDESNTYAQDLIKVSELVLSGDQLLQLSIKNISFKVVQKVEVTIDITRQLIELAEKPIRLVQEVGASMNYNTRCEVHMPGAALCVYNEVAILENACTDELQRMLNSGWRIISACPQPDQRRPDYILGRFNPEYDATDRAART